MFTNVEDAIYYIEHIKRLSRRENLDRMKYALRLLGNPEKSFKSIHVAGTNGKGSTVCYLKNILIEMGYKVGSFVSPYVIKFNERIMLNNDFISDQDIIKYTNKVKVVTDKIFEESGDVVTFFEFLTLLGFLYFKDSKVDYAVVEVGMGGILDATNVLEGSTRVITNIGFDHMSVLGNTLEEISDKKLGIVHQNDKLITTVDDSLRDYFKFKLANITNDITFIDTDYTNVKIDLDGTSFSFEGEYKTPLVGLFQANNAKLAIKTIKALFPEVTHNIIQSGLDKAAWAGRFQIICRNPLTIIDGGHNIHGINALVDSVKCLKKAKVITVFTALKDKETDKMINKLEEVTDTFIFTEINDLRKKDAEELVPECHIASVVEKDFMKAINLGKTMVKNDDILLITGSLHFISQVISTFKL